jgi:hypothetical protein
LALVSLLACLMSVMINLCSRRDLLEMQWKDLGRIAPELKGLLVWYKVFMGVLKVGVFVHQRALLRIISMATSKKRRSLKNDSSNWQADHDA